MDAKQLSLSACQLLIICFTPIFMLHSNVLLCEVQIDGMWQLRLRISATQANMVWKYTYNDVNVKHN